MDMVCIACHSTYEVKTKESMEKCESHFERNRIPGGSYRNYWRHRNAIHDPKTQKMFLVVLPREWTSNKAGKKFRPVYCMEIDQVIPAIKASCFRPIKPPPTLTKQEQERYKMLPLRGDVVAKSGTRQVWFQLEKWEPPIDYGQIMQQVFIKHYSQEEFDHIETLSSGEEESSAVGNTQPIQEDTEDTVRRLKMEVEVMKLGDQNEDDWESMY